MLRAAAKRLEDHELKDPLGADFYVGPGIDESVRLLRQWADDCEAGKK
ncbi:hypothetical protein [Actinacidiphila glaucinigra]|nr:hypothetical protein [Actinacidiphila glaucinigra]